MGADKEGERGETEEALVIEEVHSHQLDISHAPEEEFAKYVEMESYLIVIISTCCRVISESAYRWWFYFIFIFFSTQESSGTRETLIRLWTSLKLILYHIHMMKCRRGEVN